MRRKVKSSRRLREPTFSKHASARTQQRGVKPHIVNIIIVFADRTTHVGSGVKSLVITRRTANWLKSEGKISASDVSLVSNIAVLVSNDNEVVTVQRLKSGKAGRRYRRR